MAKSLSLIVPCYNEQRRLRVDELLGFASRHADCRFIMVDDGSSDDTRRMLEEMCSAQPQAFHMLRLEKNQGKAEAVRQGVLRVRRQPTSLFGFWDADGAAPLRALLPLWATLAAAEQLQMVLGVRVCRGGNQIRRHWARRLLSRLVGRVAGNVLRYPFADTICGAKLFRSTDLTLSLFDQPFQTRWLFDIEILHRFLSRHPAAGHVAVENLICELPLAEWREMKGSKLGPLEMGRAGKELLQICRLSGTARLSRARATKLKQAA